ncbi:group II intron maturase-specific domain-containing protein [Caballeronia sp. SEWSISQ10-4 2]|uniref:group II intron maturase-specific domain-containing protein n=1 Tax=Caballeronia sp. SEWSISQ10-4 2 TaxID=2937438 RepID=UPI00346322D2
MRQKTARDSWLLRQTPRLLVEVAEQCNLTIRGWWNYRGSFYWTALHRLCRYLDRELVHWTRCKTLRLDKITFRGYLRYLHQSRISLLVKYSALCDRPLPWHATLWRSEKEAETLAHQLGDDPTILPSRFGRRQSASPA